ncbi:MAG TPA: hypothetical protein VM370_03925 [Candidatus Thermoplasmatota archaeon]|nr:hypothetical protein [Candidatus Thermoplasmatota archaeon]
MQTTLALNATLGLATAGLYAVVAWIIARRSTTSEDAAKARRSFVLWWAALAVTSGLGSLGQFLAGIGVVAVSVHTTLAYLTLPLILLALAGLLQYLIYIHTGSMRWHRLILSAHLALAASFFALMTWLRPTAVKRGDWSVTIDYAREAPAWVAPLAIASILVPVLVASFAYFTLAFRTPDRFARFRILTVSGAFLLWFGSSGVAAILRWNTWYWWPLAARGIGLVATLLILFAYHPPRRIEERLRSQEAKELTYGPGGPGGWRLSYLIRLASAF